MENNSSAKPDSTGCRVLTGLWFRSIYGPTSYRSIKTSHRPSDPSARSAQKRSGLVDPKQRGVFASDPMHPDALIAVIAASTDLRGDRDSALWLPPNEGFRCEYVRQWLIAKATCGLNMAPTEREVIRDVLSKCGVVSEQHRPRVGWGRALN